MSRTGVGRTTNILNVDMQIEFGQLITQMNNVYKGLNKEQKMKILNNAAIPFINSAQAKTPVSSKIHFRYNTAKLIKGIRAPKVRVAPRRLAHLGATGSLGCSGQRRLHAAALVQVRIP